jgi:hypothetical protein
LFASVVASYVINLENTKAISKMLVSQSMTLKNKIVKAIPGWPVTLIICGVALTLVWLVLLILYPLHLLQVL